MLPPDWKIAFLRVELRLAQVDQSFRWSEHSEDHEKCRAERLGEHCLVFGIASVYRVLDQEGLMRVRRLLAPRGARAEHVERHSGNDRCQPSAEVLDVAGVGPAET